MDPCPTQPVPHRGVAAALTWPIVRDPAGSPAPSHCSCPALPVGASLVPCQPVCHLQPPTHLPPAAPTSAVMESKVVKKNYHPVGESLSWQEEESQPGLTCESKWALETRHSSIPSPGGLGPRHLPEAHAAVEKQARAGPALCQPLQEAEWLSEEGQGPSSSHRHCQMGVLVAKRSKPWTLCSSLGEDHLGGRAVALLSSTLTKPAPLQDAERTHRKAGNAY